MTPGGGRAAFQQACHRPLVSASTGGRVPVEKPRVWRQRRTADQVHLTKALVSGISNLAMRLHDSGGAADDDMHPDGPVPSS